jgi:tRNA (adenine-N(1)-)-methyltransferase non-catalytic subunit
MNNPQWVAPLEETAAPCSPAVTRPGDYILLHFDDGKQIFAQCLPGNQGGVKIQKRTYNTTNLIGLPFGTVLELHRTKGLVPVIHHHLESAQDDDDENGNVDDVNEDIDTGIKKVDSDQDASLSILNTHQLDNRNLVDTNSSQRLSSQELEQMKADTQLTGRDIVHAIIQNSATFSDKTPFSKAKYIQKKLQKYQPQCRMVPCSPVTICQALYVKDARKISNVRGDTLAQMVSYANISAGSKVMIFDTPGTCGLITGAVAKKLGGYGIILAIYDKAQPNCGDILDRFNLSFAEQTSIHWLHAGEVFVHPTSEDVEQEQGEPQKEEEEVDYERMEREALTWPCPLQPHTRKWLHTMPTDQDRSNFLDKRCARFARKLTRPSVMEVGQMARDPHRPCDSLILASKYDPTSTLLSLLPFLGPSCPFVVYSEFLEPLLTCFQKIQELGLAIHLRLCDCWMREYQVLPGRTHPFMKMSQNGGFLFMGIKVDTAVTGGIKNTRDENGVEQQNSGVTKRNGRRDKNTNTQPCNKMEVDEERIKVGEEGYEDESDDNNPKKRPRIDTQQKE